MAEWKLEGPLSDQVKALEQRACKAEATILKRDAEVAEWRNRAEVQQGAIDSLTHQLHEAMVRAINPPMIVQEPKGTAFYRDTDGAHFTQSITWQHMLTLAGPVPIEVHEVYGRRWRRLMWKKDPAHQNYVLAVYVPEPR